MDIITFEWDENKNQINQRKHGISFEEAKTVFYDEEGLQEIFRPAVCALLASMKYGWSPAPTPNFLRRPRRPAGLSARRSGAVRATRP